MGLLKDGHTMCGAYIAIGTVGYNYMDVSHCMSWAPHRYICTHACAAASPVDVK